MPKIMLALAGLLAIFVYAARYAIREPDSNAQELAFEMAKLSFQGLAVVFFTGALVQEYTRRKEEKAALNTFRKTVYTGLVRAYTSTKRVRRLLRARCRLLPEQGDATTPQAAHARAAPARGIPLGVYGKYMLSVNETQLELEILLHEVRTFRTAFSDPASLEKQIGAMESYLGRLIDEFEERLSVTTTVAGCLPLSELSELSDLIRSRRDGGDQPSRFRAEFGASLRDALTLIQGERLKV